MNEIEQKEIEEMAIIDCQRVPKGLDCSDCQFANVYNCNSYRMATALYNADYRNCKDKVVLSKEEFWKLSNKFSKKELDEIVEFHKNKARKETAREIVKWIKEHYDGVGWVLAETYFREQYGVEVE